LTGQIKTLNINKIIYIQIIGLAKGSQYLLVWKIGESGEAYVIDYLIYISVLMGKEPMDPVVK